MNTETQETQDINPAELAANLSIEQLKELMELKKNPEKVAQRKREKAYVKRRDTFIKLMSQQAMELSAQLKTLKSECLVRGNELHDLMYEVFEKEPKDMNDFSLITEDGQFKLTISRAAIVGLNETAKVHIETVQTVFREKFAKTNKAYWNMLETLLMRNDKGDYDPKMVVKLRKHADAINDPRFDAAIDGLAKATYEAGTSTYARFYRKAADTNAWIAIPMQFSSL